MILISTKIPVRKEWNRMWLTIFTIHVDNFSFAMITSLFVFLLLMLIIMR